MLAADRGDVNVEAIRGKSFGSEEFSRLPGLTSLVV
jgi:hypothetical protein